MPHQPFANNQPGVVGSSSSANLLQPPGPGLMRSKSDHRLATQFRQQEERGYDRGYGESGEESSGAPRKFGERFRQTQGSGYGTGSDRYGRQDYAQEFDSPYDSEPRSGRSTGYRSRFRRDRDNDSDNDSGQTRSVRFTEPQHKERERVIDTEDVARGPLSGITRLYDSPRVMKRISEIGKEKKKPEPKPETPTPKFQPPKKTQRQISDEDEISRIKKQNKQNTETVVSEQRPAAERVQALKRTSSGESEERTSPTSQRDDAGARKTPPVAEVNEHAQVSPPESE